MVKIKNIKTPKTIEEFRYNLKKYCLGNDDNIFIYHKINGKQYKIEVNKLSKISDVFKFIQDDRKLSITAREYNIVLMCDISKINSKDLMMNQEDAIRSLKEVYFFNNQDIEERSNFLNSTPGAIEKIVSGEIVFNQIDANPEQTAINIEILKGLYFHIFGKYFDTIGTTKMEYSLLRDN